MSRIHLRSNTLVLWLSLSAAAAASALISVGCSSSDDPGAASGGKGSVSSGGGTGKAGASSSPSEAGESAVGGESGETDVLPETGGGGREATASAGKGSTAGSPAGGSSNSNGGAAGAPGEPEQPAEGGSGGSPDVVDPEVTAAQARALIVINGLKDEDKCTTCHDVTYRGAGFYPNITPDVATGIGSWDAEDIKTAIRDGKDKDGKTLCTTMQRYPFTDDQLSDIAVFLMHLPPVSKKITAKCPSL